MADSETRTLLGSISVDGYIADWSATTEYGLGPVLDIQTNVLNQKTIPVLRFNIPIDFCNSTTTLEDPYISAVAIYLRRHTVTYDSGIATMYQVPYQTGSRIIDEYLSYAWPNETEVWTDEGSGYFFYLEDEMADLGGHSLDNNDYMLPNNFEWWPINIDNLFSGYSTDLYNNVNATTSITVALYPNVGNAQDVRYYSRNNTIEYQPYISVECTGRTTLPSLPSGKSNLVDGWTFKPVGCEDTGLITAFFPHSGVDGFGYNVYYDTCIGNEIASGTYISWIGGVLDASFYLPPPEGGAGNQVYCMLSDLGQTPEIYDIDYVEVQWYASTSPSCDVSVLVDDYLGYCNYPCAGITTSTNPLDFSNLNCWSRQFGCWLTKVDKDTVQKFSLSWSQLTRRFPLAPITTIIDDLNYMATGTQAIEQGHIMVPVWSTSSQHYIGQSYDLASSSWRGSYGDIKFRRLADMLMWFLLAVLPICSVVIILIYGPTE